MPRPEVEGIAAIVRDLDALRTTFVADFHHNPAKAGRVAILLADLGPPLSALLDYVRELEAERIHHQVVVRRLVQWLDSLSGWLEEDQAATWDMFRARLVASDSFTPPTPA